MEKSSYITWRRCFHITAKADNRFERLPNQAPDLLGGLAYAAGNMAIMGQGRFAVANRFVHYVTNSQEVAIAEKKCSLEHSFKIPRQKAEIIRYYELFDVYVDRGLEYCDIRGRQDELPEIYAHENYTESQKFAEKMYKNGANGIIYDSVRHKDGQCLAIFANHGVMGKSLGKVIFHWDGEKINIKGR